MGFGMKKNGIHTLVWLLSGYLALHKLSDLSFSGVFLFVCKVGEIRPISYVYSVPSNVGLPSFYHPLNVR